MPSPEKLRKNEVMVAVLDLKSESERQFGREMVMLYRLPRGERAPGCD